MAGIFVASYVLQVFEKGSDTTSPLKFDETVDPLYKMVRKTLEALKTPAKHPKEPHMLQVSDLVVEKDKAGLCGTIQRGEYGFSARGLKTASLESTFVRNADEAEMLPFYFRFHLHADDHVGILVLQRLGGHSPYTDLKDILLDRFRTSHPKYRLAFGRAVPAKIIQELTTGEVKTLKVVSHKKTGDPSDTYLKGTEAEVGSVETVIRAKRNKALWAKTPGWMKDLLAGKTELAKVYPNAERIQIGVNYKGRTRQYDISNAEDAAPFIDITDEVEKKDGHPKFDSINEYCVQLVEEMKEQLSI